MVCADQPTRLGTPPQQPLLPLAPDARGPSNRRVSTDAPTCGRSRSRSPALGSLRPLATPPPLSEVCRTPVDILRSIPVGVRAAVSGELQHFLLTLHERRETPQATQCFHLIMCFTACVLFKTTAQGNEKLGNSLAKIVHGRLQQ